MHSFFIKSMSLFPVTSELAVDTSVDSDCGEVTEKEIKEIKPEVDSR